METHQSVVPLGGRHARGLHLDAVHLGRPRRASPRRSACRRTACASSATTWAAASARRTGPGDHTYVAAALAKRTGRPGALRADAPRGEPRHRQPQRDGPAAHRRRAAPTARSTALRGEFVNAIGWSGFSGPTVGPMEMLYACENVRTDDLRREAQPAAERRVPRAGLRRGHVRRSSACSTSSRRSSTSTRSSCGGATTPTPTRRRPPVLVEAPARVLPPRRAVVGAPRRGARPLARDRGARRRAREPDLVRRRRPALVRLDPRRLGRPRDGRHGDAGHRHRHAHRDGADRRRGARGSARPGRRRRSATPRAARTPRSRPARRRRPSMGPAVRAAAADAKRQIVEIAAQRFDVEEGVLDIEDGRVVSADGGSWPLEEVAGLLEDAQILGKGARGPNPTGHAGAHVRRPGRRGRRRRRDRRGARRARARRPRRRPRDQPARRAEPGRGRRHPGHRAHALGGAARSTRRPGTVLTQTLDAYRMPTIADVPEIVVDLVDVPDAHLTNLGSKGLGEPPIVPTAAAIANAIRDATGADVRVLPIGREEMLRALREARERGRRRRLELLRPDSRRGGRGRARQRHGRARRRHGARAAAARPARPRGDARRRARVVPRGIDGTTHRRGHDARRARGRSGRSRTRSARRAARPRRRSSARWARSAATCSRRRAAGTGGSSSRAGCTAATAATPATGEHREHAIFGNERCASAHPSDVAAALLALDAHVRTTARELPLAELYRLPDGRRPRRGRARSRTS